MESDPIKISRLTRVFLSASFLWPFKGNEFAKDFIANVLRIIAVILSIFVAWFGILHIQVLYKGGYSLGEDLSLLMSAVELYSIFFIYSYYQREIVSLLVDLSNFDKFPKPNGFDELNQRQDFFVKCLAVYVFIALVSQKIFVILLIPTCKARELNENCGLISNTTPITLTPLLFILYAIYEQIIFFIYTKIPLIVSYHLFEISMHLVLRIEDLREMIVDCVDSKDYNVSKEKLKHCVEYHILIIDFVRRLNRCFSKSMLVHLVATGFVIACILNHIIKEKFYAYVLYLFVWLGSFWIVCYAGQTLTDASVSIGETVYNSNWILCDIRLQKDLCLILMRSQHPLNLNTGPFDHLSYALYLSVMKTTYSFLTLLMSY